MMETRPWSVEEKDRLLKALGEISSFIKYLTPFDERWKAWKELNWTRIASDHTTSRTPDEVRSMFYQYVESGLGAGFKMPRESISKAGGHLFGMPPRPSEPKVGLSPPPPPPPPPLEEEEEEEEEEGDVPLEVVDLTQGPRLQSPRAGGVVDLTQERSEKIIRLVEIEDNCQEEQEGGIGNGGAAENSGAERKKDGESKDKIDSHGNGGEARLMEIDNGSGGGVGREPVPVPEPEPAPERKGSKASEDDKGINSNGGLERTAGGGLPKSHGEAREKREEEEMVIGSLKQEEGDPPIETALDSKDLGAPKAAAVDTEQEEEESEGLPGSNQEPLEIGGRVIGAIEASRLEAVRFAEDLAVRIRIAKGDPTLRRNAGFLVQERLERWLAEEREEKKKKEKEEGKKDEDDGDEKGDSGSFEAYFGQKWDPERLNGTFLQDCEVTARNLGFPVFELSEDEAKFLPGEISESVGRYCSVRNHILHTWGKATQEFLTKACAGMAIKPAYMDLVDKAWSFLTRFGYINHGMVRGTASGNHTGEDEKDWDYNSVLVVGAGLSGLAAARQLMSMGHSVIILEGRERAGGRVYSKKMENTNNGFSVAELGGMVIYGGDDNPLSAIASQVGRQRVVLPTEAEYCPLYSSEGIRVHESIDTEANNLYQKLDNAHILLGKCTKPSTKKKLEKVSYGTAFKENFSKLEKKPNQALRDQVLNWHLANLEFSHAQEITKLSIQHCEQDHLTSMEGEHTLLRGGNSQMVEALADNLTIFYRHKVVEIEYSEKGVLVKAEFMGSSMRHFHVHCVVVTVPAGVLKKRALHFHPPLPPRKLNAIDQIGFGRLEKCVMLFPEVFWSSREFGFVNKDPEDRGLNFLFIDYSHVTGAPILLALIAGKAAKRLESEPKEAIAEKMMERLRVIFKRQGVRVPDPINVEISNWGTDEFSYGSYTSIVVGASGETHDRLAESVLDRIFFAGEHTMRKYPSSMHGAYMSGLRVAGAIHSLYSKKQRNPLLLQTGMGRKKKKKSEDSEVSNNNYGDLQKPEKRMKVMQMPETEIEEKLAEKEGEVDVQMHGEVHDQVENSDDIKKRRKLTSGNESEGTNAKSFGNDPKNLSSGSLPMDISTGSPKGSSLHPLGPQSNAYLESIEREMEELRKQQVEELNEMKTRHAEALKRLENKAKDAAELESGDLAPRDFSGFRASREDVELDRKIRKCFSVPDFGFGKYLVKLGVGSEFEEYALMLKGALLSDRTQLLGHSSCVMVRENLVRSFKIMVTSNEEDDLEKVEGFMQNPLTFSEKAKRLIDYLASQTASQ